MGDSTIFWRVPVAQRGGGFTTALFVLKIKGDNYMLASWNFIHKYIGPSYVHWSQKKFDRAQRGPSTAAIFTAVSPKSAKIGHIWKTGFQFSKSHKNWHGSLVWWQKLCAKKSNRFRHFKARAQRGLFSRRILKKRPHFARALNGQVLFFFAFTYLRPKDYPCQFLWKPLGCFTRLQIWFRIYAGLLPQ